VFGQPTGGGGDGGEQAPPGRAGTLPGDGPPGAGGAADPGQRPPFPPRIALAPQAPYPVQEAGQGMPGDRSVPPGGYPLSDSFPLSDAYDPVEDYDSADAYGPAEGYDDGYDPAGDYPPAAGPADGAAGGWPEAGAGEDSAAGPGARVAADATAEAGDDRAAEAEVTGPGQDADVAVPAPDADTAVPGQEPEAANGQAGPDQNGAAGAGQARDDLSGAAQSGNGVPGGAFPEVAARPAAPHRPVPQVAVPQVAVPQIPVPPPPPARQPPAPVRPVPAQPAPAYPGLAGETADSLTADLLLPGRRPPPADGWRRLLHRSTGGLVRVPQSAAELRRQELLLRACTPVAGGHHRVAVLSLKGGVGKTTTVMGLGATLASLRGDRVIAVDANPDRGTLSDKLRLETSATIRDLLNERGQVSRYADVRAFTTQAPSRLEVLASDRDPTVSVAFSEQDYLEVARLLEHFYSICITDCGTGLLHSAMTGVLRVADQIILVSSPSVDGARSASATLDWLTAHDYGHLVRSAVVVLSAVRPRGKSTVDMVRLEQHFAARCRAVTEIPYDAHLAEGAEVDLAQLAKPTADAYLALSAEIGDGFGGRRRPG
jgi:MinD-like ATPase involved in chromosome partitioning or flagellar assembly